MSRPLFISCEVWRTAFSISGIIKDICSRIDMDNYALSPYSQDIDSVGIIVNCHPDENLAAGWGKPRRYISNKKRSADIRLPIPFEDYINADPDTQYLMVVKNIVQSVAAVGDICRKSRRARFDSDAMIHDLLEKLGITSENLEDVAGVIPDESYARIVSGGR